MLNETIDAMVAVHVMGWTLAPNRSMWFDAEDPWRSVLLWNPTTRADHAKQVKAKMRADGWDYIIQASHGAYSCTFQTGSGQDYRVFLLDCQPTEEMAVALAALAAKGGTL